jgi:hypothetical protein
MVINVEHVAKTRINFTFTKITVTVMSYLRKRQLETYRTTNACEPVREDWMTTGSGRHPEHCPFQSPHA